MLHWRNNIGKCNGHIMRKEDKVLQVQTTDMYSDAGEHMMGGAQFRGEHIVKGSVFKQYFSEEESRMSSTFRELRAFEKGIRIKGEQFRGHQVRWGCYNWAASKIITLGSMKPECHEVAKAIVKLVMKFDIVLEPFWLSRESREIKVCDTLSKDFDMSDYRLSGQDFSMLQDRFGPFPSTYSAVASRPGIGRSLLWWIVRALQVWMRSALTGVSGGMGSSILPWGWWPRR